MGMDDAELRLIQQAVSGSPVAFEQFLLKHRGRLIGYLSRRVPEDLRRVVDCQDIFQDVCFEAFRRVGTFAATDTRSAFRWLMVMARNRTIHLIRMHRAAKRQPGRLNDIGAVRDWKNESMVLLLQDLAVYERTPSQSAAWHELMAILQQCVSHLPPDYRQAIRLRYLESLPVGEIARRMSRTDRAVHMLCNRGLKLIRIEMRSASRYL